MTPLATTELGTDVQKLRAALEAILRSARDIPKWAEQDARRVLAETARK